MKRKILLTALFLLLMVLFPVCWKFGNKSDSGNGKTVTSGGQKQQEEDADIDIENIISFGSYEQDNDKANGKESIEWIILEEKEDKLLVISKYVLDRHRYGVGEVTWETSDVREWLNTEFINEAFTEEEQERILFTELENPDNADYGTDGGNPTVDRIFFLSADEEEKFFPTVKEKQAYLTNYAVSRIGSLQDDQEEKLANGEKFLSSYMLRTMGRDNTYVACVGSDGYIFLMGNEAVYARNMVRPAMWIAKE